MNNPSIWKSLVLVSLFSILLASLSYAITLIPGGGGGGTASGPTAIASALLSLCETVKGFLGVAMMLMILLAAVIYAAGQVMGAETRARASVWATAMFTGAIFAAIIFLIVPWVIGLVVGGDVSDQI